MDFDKLKLIEIFDNQNSTTSSSTYKLIWLGLSSAGISLIYKLKLLAFKIKLICLG